MDDARGVRRCQSGCRLDRDIENFAQTQGTALDALAASSDPHRRSGPAAGP
jgi:hypothetical protein